MIRGDLLRAARLPESSSQQENVRQSVDHEQNASRGTIRP